MGRPSPRHDGELEAAMYRGISSAAKTLERHRGHHAHLPPLPWPSASLFSRSQQRFNTSLRPVPEVYPLVGAVGAALAFASIIITHDLRTNHEVFVRKETRRMQVCTPDEDPAEYDRLTSLAKKHYDNGLRRYVLGYKPWVFSRFQEWASGVSREDPTVDLSREKWTLRDRERPPRAPSP